MEYTTTVDAQEAIAITIGNFDGIHKGHQYLMQRLISVAQQLKSKPVLVSFAPHTLQVVRPELYASSLTPATEKLSLAREFGGIADSIIIHFTPEVAAMSAQEFMDTLRLNFTLTAIVVGANFSLGRNRMGDTSFLQTYGQHHGILVDVVSLAEIDNTRISSTRIRALVSNGEIAEANTLLGHPLRIGGSVIHGDQRGRQLGFPTANLHTDPFQLLPADGVYAVCVTITDENGRSDSPSRSDVYNGVVNIGVRPTFNGTERLVEVHLLDVDLDLYDKHLTVDFIDRLRGEQRFSGIEALKAQITSDVEKARQILTTRRVSN